MAKEDWAELKARALKAKGLVDYKRASVVSRTIVQKKGGTVTLFSLDKGQGLSEHTAPFDAIVEVVDGEAEIRVDGRPSIVKAGEFIIMPAHKPHALKAVKRFKMALIMIKA